MMRVCFLGGLLALATCQASFAGTVLFGDENVLGTGTYSTDPTTGATLEGLAAGVVTDSTVFVGHGYPFSPGAGEFPGTDQIYVGSTQTGAHDGYSVAGERINGPDVLVLDYSSLVPVGQTITSLTLGIAADDFQFPSFGQPFTALINGTTDAALTSQLNSIDEGGPVVHFFTIGIGLGSLLPSNILTLSIDNGGDGGDGYAVDFLTIGVTTQAEGVVVPEPGTLIGLSMGVAAFAVARFRRKKS